MKNYNILIDGKSFFHTPIRNKEEACEKTIKTGIDNHSAKGNLLD